MNELENNNRQKDIQINDILKRLQILEEKEKEKERSKDKENEMEKKEKGLNDLKESSICKNNEISFFVEEFKNHEKFKGKNFGFKLLYMATRDGDKVRDFHNKCDNNISVLILIKTNKNNRFGGYSEVGFNNNGSELNDNKAFVFSLDKKRFIKIMKILQYIVKIVFLVSKIQFIYMIITLIIIQIE